MTSLVEYTVKSLGSHRPLGKMTFSICLWSTCVYLVIFPMAATTLGTASVTLQGQVPDTVGSLLIFFLSPWVGTVERPLKGWICKAPKGPGGEGLVLSARQH